MTSDNFPLLSVIVPIYNVDRYLKKCLDSLLNQTYTNLEIILINDGSTDSSYEICKQYAGKDPRFRLINKENGGLGQARNVGLENANGDIYAFVDSDDWIDIRMFEKMISAMEEYNADIVQCNYCRTRSEKINVLEQTEYPQLYKGRDIIPKLFSTEQLSPDINLLVV